MAVAEVCVEAPGAPDHPFSYAVPAGLAGVAPGVRVRVPFGSGTVHGWVLGVAPVDPDDAPAVAAAGQLRPLAKLVSPLPALDADVAAVARETADHYGGTLADVLRSAVPPRHAAAETAFLAARPTPLPVHLPADAGAGAPPDRRLPADAGVGVPPDRRLLAGAGVGVPPDRRLLAGAGVGGPPDRRLLAGAGVKGPPDRHLLADAGVGGWVGEWDGVRGGAALLRRVRQGQGPAAAVVLPPTARPWSALAALAAHVPAGRAALLLVPDVADADGLAAEVAAALPDAAVAVLHHGLSAHDRWLVFLRVAAGEVDVLVGTRAAAFAPLLRLGLVAVWDDGDPGHAEPRAPGWHARVVAGLRARRAGAALVLAGHSRSVPAQWLVRTGEVKGLEPDRATRRRAARVVVPRPGDPVEAAARVPHTAHAVVAEGLRRGPVLVGVQRRGYAPGVACRTCALPARCPHCGGPLGVAAKDAPPACGWCARRPAGWECPRCRGADLRATAVGARRTAEEFGRAFPGVPVTAADAEHPVAEVGPAPRLVVATPGSEPVAEGGYAAAAVLDGDAALARRALDAPADAARRWLHVVSLVRPAADGGVVVISADPSSPVVQAVVASTSERLADRLCDERAEAGLPPARAAAAVTGPAPAVARAAASLRGAPEDGVLLPGPDASAEPRPVEVLGPAPVAPSRADGGQEPRARVLVLGARHDVVAAARELSRVPGPRRFAGTGDRVAVRVDPEDL